MEQALISTYRIRPATLADIPALSTLIDVSIRGLSVGHYTPAQISASIGPLFGVDTTLIRDSTYFVVTPLSTPTLIVASGGWSFRKSTWGGDESRSGRAEGVRTAGEDPASIRAMFVRPGWERKGLGRMLLRFCEAEAVRNGFERLELGSTLPGLQFYESEGYVRGEEKEVDLRDGVSLMIVSMRKDA